MNTIKHFTALKIEKAEEALSFMFRVEISKGYNLLIFQKTYFYCNYLVQYAHKMTWDVRSVKIAFLRSH